MLKIKHSLGLAVCADNPQAWEAETCRSLGLADQPVSPTCQVSSRWEIGYWKKNDAQEVTSHVLFWYRDTCANAHTSAGTHACDFRGAVSLSGLVSYREIRKAERETLRKDHRSWDMWYTQGVLTCSVYEPYTERFPAGLWIHFLLGIKLKGALYTLSSLFHMQFNIQAFSSPTIVLPSTVSTSRSTMCCKTLEFH